MLCLGHLSLWSGVVRDTSPAYVHATLHESIHPSIPSLHYVQARGVRPSVGGVVCGRVIMYSKVHGMNVLIYLPGLWK